MSAIQALEQWCRFQCAGYRDVNITNMTTSFRSGLAFCALIHKHRPDLIDYDSLRMEDVFDNNKLAFQVAEEELEIPALLDAEDMVALRIPDRLSILTYVSQYYNYFKARPPRVKRPAEGSQWAPSEKKNVPVAAKAKTVIKNQAPPTLAGGTSPKLAKASAQKPIPNKTGTLNSKCVACKSHVHLVQRHFVEGKLFHRSCFICCECSVTLHAGGYKPGKDPDTFVCRVHPEKISKPSREGRIMPASGLLHSAIHIQPAPSSEPVRPVNPTQCWTASAQKTQAARQNFFQAVPPPSPPWRKSTEPSGRPAFPQWPHIHEGKAGKKLAEENCNNNNKRLFTIRSAERRFGGESAPAENSTASKIKCSKSPARNFRTSEEFARPEAIKYSDTRPTTTTDQSYEKQSKPKSVESKAEPPRKDAASSSKQHRYDFSSTSFSNVSTTPTRPPPTSVTVLPPHPVTFSPAGQGHLADPPRRCSPVKSPARWPAMEAISSPTSAVEIPSGAKKGKYLSPTNAPSAEMRSPSRTSYHIQTERIERELGDIESNLALLEREGVELERKLRRCEEEGEGDLLMDPLMVDWFKLIRKKQMFIRKESELVYTARTQELEREQPRVEQELRRLLEKPDRAKSAEERAREKMLMRNLMEIVDGRNAIVEVLDDDRLRELAEDEELNTMMKNLGVKKGKPKRKSSLSKLFGRRSKRRVE
ncbi:MICAL-like protein 2a isoform X2 [Phyllopteryx taeniolatus]|uniref:MICAL-like protein 2a isoform X2 n=1 Tax=Phyllopteryx taeniolatus TaxID=161469 RepID=UPI002AD2D0AF|nr:MICAL-like protein 2a isoform X2 [Phyllopteryx taeniolatus]